MNIDLVHTNVFTRNNKLLHDIDTRFILNQGGSRSSKTYSICQMLIVYCLTHTDKVVSVVRKGFPSLRATAMRDCFEIMMGLGLYDRRRHNKTEHTYLFPSGSMLEFFSVDEEQKVRGRKRDVLWCNEANELWEDDFTQLNLRTSGKLIFDYNPSELSGYLYGLGERKNAEIIKSTFRDNPFLAQSQIDELEHLKHTDPDMYRIYNLGERAQTSTHVLRHWKTMAKPEGLEEICYGLDFGWVHPTALIRIFHDGTGKHFHLQQVVYERSLTIGQLGARMLTNINKDHAVAADHARPDAISELQALGLNVFKADKAVKKGLNVLKSAVLTVDPDSGDLIKDLENYRYKKHAGRVVDEVLKLHDDGCDAARYGAVYAKSAGAGIQFATLDW